MNTDPRTKEQFLNRILSYDFDGDLAHIGESKAVIERITSNRVCVRLPATGQHYEIVIRKPRAKPIRSRRVRPLHDAAPTRRPSRAR